MSEQEFRTLSIKLEEKLKARVKTAAILSGMTVSEFCAELFTEATERLVAFQHECRAKYQYVMIDRALEEIATASLAPKEGDTGK